MDANGLVTAVDEGSATITTDQDRKAYEEEIGPLIDQLQAVTEKHGYAGVATIQFGYRIDPAERRSSWTLGHFLLNTGRLATQADHRRKHHPRGFSSLQEAKDYFERTGHQPASPLLVALVARSARRADRIPQPRHG